MNFRISNISFHFIFISRRLRLFHLVVDLICFRLGSNKKCAFNRISFYGLTYFLCRLLLILEIFNFSG